jgi:hypothetical protein
MNLCHKKEIIFIFFIGFSIFFYKNVYAQTDYWWRYNEEGDTIHLPIMIYTSTPSDLYLKNLNCRL